MICPSMKDIYFSVININSDQICVPDSLYHKPVVKLFFFETPAVVTSQTFLLQHN